jgi:hypothetical protein
MYRWAYYNMRPRFEKWQFEEHPVNMDEYFWGLKNRHGYVNEAFGTHLALFHSEVLNNNISMQQFKEKRSVI